MHNLHCRECGSRDLDLVFGPDAVCDACGTQLAFSYAESLRAADEGDLMACAIVGDYCCEGLDGVKRDYAQARCYYMKAAEAGFAPAMRKVGYLYENALGVKQDMDKALEWYKKAAALDDIRAIFNVGVLYIHHFETNFEEAIGCYERAAEAGLLRAMTTLGMCYVYGDHVERDLEQGISLLKRAAEGGETKAWTLLADLYAEGNGVGRYAAHYKEMAEAGSARGMMMLGLCYMQGTGVEIDAKLADYWLQQAVENGEEDAIEHLEWHRKSLLSTLWDSAKSLWRK